MPLSLSSLTHAAHVIYNVTPFSVSLSLSHSVHVCAPCFSLLFVYVAAATTLLLLRTHSVAENQAEHEGEEEEEEDLVG